MIFTTQKCIFVHVKKTAGNFFSRTFLRYSDDQMSVEDDQDGIERFEIKGRHTLAKHQYVRHYRKLLGADFAHYTVYATVRPPLERLISLCYTPRRLQKAQQIVSSTVDYAQRPIALEVFETVVNTEDSIWEILDLDNATVAPTLSTPGQHVAGAKIKLLDFSNLSAEMKAFAETYGFDITDQPEHPINATGAKRNPLELNAHQMDKLRELVSNSKHAADFALFE